MEQKTQDSSKPDRKLGDEWEDWTGDLDESISYEETASLFILYGSLALLLILACLGLVLYMIEPRLHLINPVFVFAAQTITVLLILVIAGLGTMVIVSAFTGRNLFFHSRLGQVAASRILPLALTIARRLGISRDRLGNSFVIFSNALVKASHKPGAGKTIILIPRCLKAEMRKEVQELGNRAGVGVFIATGGGEARQVIRQERPSAVIGVACERDLISGISDVASTIPAMGICNKRPEGPCKNTLINLDDLKKAIETLTGVKFEQ
ncbi:MAG: DUF116 domain-containing protein [Candidatus Latescibacter sp.]|nr:DUF116 domain-containing protein [Candidatus Latescibacter sp.]